MSVNFSRKLSSVKLGRENISNQLNKLILIKIRFENDQFQEIRLKSLVFHFI